MKNNDYLHSISASQLLETMAEGVMLIGTDGRIRIWNQAMSDMTGYDAGEVIGKTTEGLRVADCTGARRVFSLLQETGSNAQCLNGCECQMLAKSGEKIPVMVNARLLKNDEGKAIGILQTITDFRPVYNLQQEIAAMTSRLISEESFHGIIGRSQAMQRIFRLISLAADSDASVIILGESGTGKELVADAIQKLGNRSSQAFIKVNCGALPENLLESELFGHEKGAFTGAVKKRTGRFEAADGGTVFLDEIGDISAAMQVKLLRVLQNGELQRVGGETTIKVNVRIIAATNKDLSREVREGRFREDLYYRLRVFPIALPPLRERHEDIPIIAKHLVNRFSARTGRLITGLNREAMKTLVAYTWPGNVRELENAIEYAFVVCQQKLIGIDDLPAELNPALASPTIDRNSFYSGTTPVFSRQETRRTVRDPQKLREILVECDWNKAEAGRRLGLSRTAVWKWMLKHGINR